MQHATSQPTAYDSLEPDVKYRGPKVKIKTDRQTNKHTHTRPTALSGPQQTSW